MRTTARRFASRRSRGSRAARRRSLRRFARRRRCAANAINRTRSNTGTAVTAPRRARPSAGANSYVYRIFSKFELLCSPFQSFCCQLPSFHCDCGAAVKLVSHFFSSRRIPKFMSMRKRGRSGDRHSSREAHRSRSRETDRHRRNPATDNPSRSDHAALVPLPPPPTLLSRTADKLPPPPPATKFGSDGILAPPKRVFMANVDPSVLSSHLRSLFTHFGIALASAERVRRGPPLGSLLPPPGPTEASFPRPLDIFMEADGMTLEFASATDAVIAVKVMDGGYINGKCVRLRLIH